MVVNAISCPLCAGDATIEQARTKVRFPNERRVNSMALPRREWLDMTWQDITGAATARWIAVLPLAAVLSGLLDFAVSFVVFLAMMLYYRVTPGPAVLWFPGFLSLAVLTALGV